MIMNRNRKKLLLGLAGTVVLLVMVSNSFAQSSGGGALQMKLDRPVKLKLTDKPIGEVFDKLSRVTQIDFKISPDTLEFLPYGAETRLNITIPDVTLRSALSQILNPQALNWEVNGNRVLIVPSEPLYRMCHRATYDEMELLGKIILGQVEELDEHKSIVGSLRSAIDDKKIKVIFPSELNKEYLAAAFKQASETLPHSAGVWLDLICQPLGLTWYLEGKNIILISRKAQVKRQLNRVVSLRYQNSRLSNILLDLARKGRVKVTMVPGVMKSLAKRVRSDFTLIMADATIAQALEIICGATGLEFPTNDEGFLVKTSLYLEVNPEGSAPKNWQQPTKRKRPRFIVKTVLQKGDNKTVDLYILPEHLPEELRKAIDAEREKIIKELSEKYGITESKDSPKEQP